VTAIVVTFPLIPLLIIEATNDASFLAYYELTEVSINSTSNNRSDPCLSSLR